MRLVLYSAFVSVLAVSEASSQVPEALNHIDTQILQGDRTLISSRSWLRGAHLVGKKADITPQLTAFIPQDWQSGRVCSRFTLVSGRYVSSSDFEVPNNWEGKRALLDFEIEDGFEPILAETSMEDSGITIENRPCEYVGEDVDLVYTAGFWNSQLSPGAAPKEMVLNLNVSRVDELVAEAFVRSERGENLAEQSVEATCVRLESDVALSFNYRCRVPLNGLEQGKLRFRYTRLYSGEESDPRQAIILFGVE